MTIDLAGVRARLDGLPLTAQDGPDYAEVFGAANEKVALTTRPQMLLVLNEVPALLDYVERLKSGLNTGAAWFDSLADGMAGVGFSEPTIHSAREKAAHLRSLIQETNND